MVKGRFSGLFAGFLVFLRVFYGVFVGFYGVFVGFYVFFKECFYLFSRVT